MAGLAASTDVATFDAGVLLTTDFVDASGLAALAATGAFVTAVWVAGARLAGCLTAGLTMDFLAA